MEATVLGDPVAQSTPVPDECVVDQFGHRLARRGVGVFRRARHLGGDDAVEGQNADDVVDVTVGRVVGASCQVKQVVEGQLGTYGRYVAAGIGRVHQGSQDAPRDGALIGGQPV